MHVCEHDVVDEGDLFEFISVDPAVWHGQACIRGTRSPSASSSTAWPRR